MTKPEKIDPDMTIDEIMRRWPATIRVLIRNGMLCIGCPIGIFHTVADACDAHRIDQEEFSMELLAAMRSDPSANSPSAFIGDGAATLRQPRLRPAQDVRAAAEHDAPTTKAASVGSRPPASARAGRSPSPSGGRR